MKIALLTIAAFILITAQAKAENYFTIEITSPDAQRKNTIVIANVETLSEGVKKIEQQMSHLPFTKTYYTDHIIATFRNGMHITRLNKVINEDSEIEIKIYRNGKLEKTYKNKGLGNQITIKKIQGSNNPYDHKYEKKGEY